jgi:hypothetical protein
MAPLRLRSVGHTTYDVEDDIRHLRDSNAGEPEPDGRADAEPAPIAAVGTKPRKSSRRGGS